jgi:hypothetical protein
VRRVLFLLALVSWADSSAADGFDLHRLDDPSLVAALQHVAWLGLRRPDGNTEVAAFLVEHEGGVECVLWPHTMSFKSATFAGAPPRGTIAIVHTHPPTIPEPSAGDVARARQLGLASYVVTRWEVHVIDPASGQVLTLLRRQDWLRNGSRSACKELAADRR